MLTSPLTARAPANAVRPGRTVPERVGKYEIIKQVGRGSTGCVYLSNDPYYGRDVAIKIYNIEPDDNPEKARVARKMFLSEAHMVGMLQHPNILPIFDAGEEAGHYYIVTEFIHGARTLAAYCKPDNLLRMPDLIEIIYKCAKALSYAHGRGVIHRDIKPSNIMLTVDNDVRIIDFGIAIVADSEISRIEGIAGSPSYMSPEQVQSLEITNRSDLYALGAVMYELLTGHRPFRANNLSKLLHQIVYATPPPIHTLRKDVPEELEELIARAMHKDPARRHRSGLKFAADLARVHQKLRSATPRSNDQDQFGLLRRLKFFHDFGHAEIFELLRAAQWQDYQRGEEIVKEGEIDDRFYVIVSGAVAVERMGRHLGLLGQGDCFGETSYVRGAKRQATIRAQDDVTVMKVSSTLLEQVSASCQLRFNKAFLHSLIARLQNVS
jgi:eukaryotic-like serine/threonine-protein kinase